MKSLPYLALALCVAALPLMIAAGATKAEYDVKVADEKSPPAVETDEISCKRLTIKSKDGLASFTVQAFGDGGVGMWVADKHGSVCIVAGLHDKTPPYFGVMPAHNEAKGCPLAIAVDGSIQLADRKDVKRLTVATLLKLAR